MVDAVGSEAAGVGTEQLSDLLSVRRTDLECAGGVAELLILELMVALDLTNTLTALILVYTAQGLPLAIFILAEFIAQIPWAP